MFYLGIDLGTSAVKILLVSKEGDIRGSVTKEYPLIFPKPGWSEQKPELWWEAVKEGIRELLGTAGGYAGQEDRRGQRQTRKAQPEDTPRQMERGDIHK